MSAEVIAAALGEARREGRGWRTRCPIHGGDSLTLADGDGGKLLVKCWAGCNIAEILAELRELGLGHGAAGEAPQPDPEAARRRAEKDAAEQRRKTGLARDMWRSASPADGTIAERYLRYRLPGLGEIPPTIRYLPPGSPYASHPDGNGWPVMIAAVKREGEAGIVAVSRTWIAMDGRGKASLRPPRKFTGSVAGGAVRLAPVAETLIVAEGVETTLATMIATGLPAWAALSAGGIRSLVLPATVRTVIVAADNDAAGTGECAARDAADRWLAEGRRVRIALPPEPGTDFADLLHSPVVMTRQGYSHV
jgi:putative DNA primase/helicase